MRARVPRAGGWVDPTRYFGLAGMGERHAQVLKLIESAELMLVEPSGRSGIR